MGSATPLGTSGFFALSGPGFCAGIASLLAEESARKKIVKFDDRTIGETNRFTSSGTCKYEGLVPKCVRPVDRGAKKKITTFDDRTVAEANWLTSSETYKAMAAVPHRASPRDRETRKNREFRRLNYSRQDFIA